MEPPSRVPSSAQAEAKDAGQELTGRSSASHQLLWFYGSRTGLRQPQLFRTWGGQRDHITVKQASWKVFLNTTRKEEGDAIPIIPLNINYNTATFKLEHLPVDN